MAIEAREAVYLRPSTDRGRARIDWLDSYHSFSFGDYYDPMHMGFGPLRVINEDYVSPGKGFHPHPHRDMEIITIILSGRIAHEDSMGNRYELLPDEVQRMTAGTGVTHSEFNPSDSETLHLLQIWIRPDMHDLPPSYEQKRFDRYRNQWQLLVSPDGEDGSLKIHQNVRLHRVRLDAGRQVSITNHPAWIQMIEGRILLPANGEEIRLQTGDGLGLALPEACVLSAEEGTDLLWFEFV